VRGFDVFTTENDTYGEHDFGSVTIDGTNLFWKIDYYGLSLQYGSSDPSDRGTNRGWDFSFIHSLTKSLRSQWIERVGCARLMPNAVAASSRTQMSLLSDDC
jgi:hypothetical protein